MKPASIILLISLCCLSMKLRSNTLEKIIYRFYNFQTTKDIDNYFEKEINDTNELIVNRFIYRSIEFNFKQIVYHIREASGGTQSLEIYLITRNDSIALGIGRVLNRIRENQTVKVKQFKIKNEIIDDYLNKYREVYNYNLKKRSFIKIMSTIRYYGFACGLHRNNISKNGFRTLKYIEKEEYKKLALMLKNPCPEIKAFGVTGLKHLERKGIAIQKAENELIQRLDSISYKIYTCLGCIKKEIEYTEAIEIGLKDVSR